MAGASCPRIAKQSARRDPDKLGNCRAGPKRTTRKDNGANESLQMVVGTTGPRHAKVSARARRKSTPPPPRGANLEQRLLHGSVTKRTIATNDIRSWGSRGKQRRCLDPRPTFQRITHPPAHRHAPGRMACFGALTPIAAKPHPSIGACITAPSSRTLPLTCYHAASLESLVQGEPQDL